MRYCNCNIPNNDYGIKLWDSSNNNTIYNCNISNNDYGIKLWDSSNNNTITSNTITNNSEKGIWLCYFSSNNIVYHNNFINNFNQAYDEDNNIWDNGYPSGGNYWSDYTGVDNYHGPNQDIPGSDGIGDTPYYISFLLPSMFGSNQDMFPLMHQWGERKKGDWQGDCDIDYDDFIAFADAYGSHCDDVNYHPLGDFNNDCVIDFDDFMMFADTYPSGCDRIKGDENGDGHVSWTDLITFADCYGSHCGNVNYDLIFDFDDDCNVDFDDFIMFADAYEPGYG